MAGTWFRATRFASAALCLRALPGCTSDLVAGVSTDICASGQRWIGDLTPHAEMFPGRDCVGCHRRLDGPEFLAGGTVYGLADPEGLRTTQHDCFGVEGAHVTITAADGQVFETLTNRAGNFYIEGREAALAKPFRVAVEYTFPDGRQSREPMNSHPSYGGCARCHRPDVEETPGAEPGAVLGPGEVVEGAYPIFTGPVDE